MGETGCWIKVGVMASSERKATWGPHPVSCGLGERDMDAHLGHDLPYFCKVFTPAQACPREEVLYKTSPDVVSPVPPTTHERVRAQSRAVNTYIFSSCVLTSS